MANPNPTAKACEPRPADLRVLLCGDAAATRRAAAAWTARLVPGKPLPTPGAPPWSGVIGLDGPLGVGKTEFVKGLAEAWGCKGPVTSPTFSIAHEYAGEKMVLFHFDFHRLEGPDELETCGFFECVGQGVIVAEWAAKFRDALPAGTLRIEIGILPDGRTRRIRLEPS